MKNIFLFLLSLLVSTGMTLKAQNSENENNNKAISFGAKAGINISNVWDKNGDDFVAKSKAGFAGGIFLGIPVGEFLGVQPEVLLSQKGFRGTGSLLGLPYSFSRTTTYIDIPLQLQLRPTPSFTIVLGPQFSFLIHEKNVFDNGFITSEQREAFNNDNLRKNILGAVAGADYSISHLVLSGRVGFDLLNNNGDGTTDTPRYKNAWVQLTIGFKI